MKRLRWQITIVVLALTAIGLLVLTQRSEQPPQTTDNPEITGPQPISGGVYTEALIGSPVRLNPVLDFFNPVDRDVDALIYSSLVRFNDKGLPEVDLAESWGISRDGTVYNFSLKTDALWHDGEPVTSADIVFTIDLLRSDGLPVPEDLREFWISVDVDPLDTHLVQFRLPEPFAPFLDYLTFGVLPEHLLGSLESGDLPEAAFNLDPVGSGPYRFDSWLAEGEEITGVSLTAFDGYYGGEIFIDQIVFRYYETPTEALEAYQEGTVLGVGQISREILAEALAEPDLNLYTSRLPELTMVLLNLDLSRAPFFQDLEVRKALLQAINRQRMIDTLLLGQAFIADSPVFPGNWAYFQGLDPMAYSSELAEDRLRTAGYTIPAEGGSTREKDDLPLSFTLIHTDDADMHRIAQFLQQSWAKIGVSVELEAVDYEELVDQRLSAGRFEAALVELSLLRSPDPDPYPFWHQAQIGSGQNYARWDNRAASEYLEQARLTSDLDERIRLYRNFQVLFNRELPALLLFYPVYTYGVDAQVEGVTVGPLFDPSDRFANADSWFILQGEPVIEPAVTEGE